MHCCTSWLWSCEIFFNWNYTDFFFSTNWNFINERINASMWSSSGHSHWETKDKGAWVNPADSERWDRMHRLIAVSSQTVQKDTLKIRTWLANERTQQTRAGLGCRHLFSLRPVQKSPPRRSCIATVLQHYFLQNELQVHYIHWIFML